MSKQSHKLQRVITVVVIVFSVCQSMYAAEGDEANQFNQNFQFEPLERGFGSTVGNALRRVLLSSLEDDFTTLRTRTGLDGGLIFEPDIDLTWLKDLPGYTSIGPDVIFPVDNKPNLIGTGAGIVLQTTSSPFIVIGEDIDGEAIATISFTGTVGIFGQDADDNSQLNQLGGVNKKASDIFGLEFEPGLELTIPLTRRVHFLLQGGGHFNYRTADLDTVKFDRRNTQVVVKSFENSASGVGYFVGGGIRTSVGSVIIDTKLNYESYRTDFLTGNDRWEEYLVLRIIFPLL